MGGARSWGLVSVYIIEEIVWYFTVTFLKVGTGKARGTRKILLVGRSRVYYDGPLRHPGQTPLITCYV